MRDAELAELVKRAFVEAFEEQRDLLYDIVAEVLEDFALARAINEGEDSETVTREEVFALLRDPT